MKARHVVSVVFVLALLLSACGGGGAAKTVKVAILAPLSGPVPTFGVSTRDGALMAIDEWNAKGGVLGMQIEPVVADSQCTADPAVNAANKVIDTDGVHYIVGEVCSKASIPISEIAEAKKVLMISPTSTNTQVTKNADGTTKKYVFRACFIDPFQGKVGAAFAMKKGFKTAFVLFDQGNDYVRGLAEGVRGVLHRRWRADSRQGELHRDRHLTSRPILAKVADAKPDLVYLPDYYNIVNLVTAQAKREGHHRSFMGGDGWDSVRPEQDARLPVASTPITTRSRTRGPIVSTLVSRTTAPEVQGRLNGAPAGPGCAGRPGL